MDVKRVARFDVAAQELFGKWILEEFLDCAPHRAGAVCRVVPFVDQEFYRRRIELDFDGLRSDASDDLRDFEIDNLGQILTAKRVEDDDVVQTVQKLRFEGSLRFLKNLVAHLLVGIGPGAGTKSQRSLTLDQFGADI